MRVVPKPHVSTTYRKTAEKAARKATVREYLEPRMAAMMKVLVWCELDYSISNFGERDGEEGGVEVCVHLK